MNQNKRENPKKKKYFVDNWLSDSAFDRWLAKDKGNSTKARCTVRHKQIELSSSGRSALTDYAKGKKHMQMIEKREGSLRTSSTRTKKSTEAINEKDYEGQKTVDMYLYNSDVSKAELIWTLKSVMDGFSVRSNDRLNETLLAMFPDSKIAGKFNMARTKSMYTINHGIYPYFRSLLLSSLSKSNILVYSFDESLNDVTQTCEMDLYMLYWDAVCSQVNVRYFGSSFLGHGTHSDILGHIDKITKDLNPAHLYQVSMDGPIVNPKFYQEFCSKLKDEKYHSLIDIDSCGLHVVHGSLKTGAEKSNWCLKKLLKGAYTLFHDSPVRREDYESITASSTYPLNFCSTR